MSRCSVQSHNNCRFLMDNSWAWGDRPQAGTAMPGIYVIKEDDIAIYVGRSQDVRSRLNAHFAGSGQQAIDKYIAGKGNLFRDRHFSVIWVQDARQRCTEHCYTNIIANLQDSWPRFNLQSGDTC